MEYNAQFALLLGGAVTLGFDATQPFDASPAQLAAWDEVQQATGTHLSLHGWLARHLTPLRQVTIPPLLVETTAPRIIARRVRTHPRWHAGDPSTAGKPP